MNLQRQTFSNNERLKSAREIASLFEKGNTFLSYPVKVVWYEATFDKISPAQVAFTVSRKTFKTAVQRNLLKRRMREAFRKNKNILYQTLTHQKISIVFVYIARIEEPYSIIEKGVKNSLKRLGTMYKQEM